MKNAVSIFLVVVVSLFLTACCTKPSLATVIRRDGQLFGYYSNGILHVQSEASDCGNAEITKQNAEDNAWKCLVSCLLDLSKGQVCDLDRIRSCHTLFNYCDDGSVKCSLYAEIPREWRDAWQLQ